MTKQANQTAREARPDDASSLLSAFRSGEVDAGYELLGRQATLGQWKEVLSAFAASGNPDLERIAGSTLGRHPDVVSRVIDVLEASATPQALFVTHAIATLRDEPHLVEQARDVEATLRKRHHKLLDGRDGKAGTSSLYVLLAEPLAAQKKIWTSWQTAAPQKPDRVAKALRDEDDRLQRLSKERSYKAGSYFHFFRHALADLVLVAAINTELGKRAFALLQRRSDDADDQEELLLAIPEETRRRYLAWALEVRNSEVVPRARFALRMLRERFPDKADGEALLALCKRGESVVAVDAAITSIEVGLDSPALTAEIARLLTDVGAEDARRLAQVVAQAPERLHLDRIARNRRALIFESAAAASSGFGRAVVSQLRRLPADEINEALTALEGVTPKAAPPDVFQAAAVELAQLASENESHSHVLIDALSGVRFREGAWAALTTLDNGTRKMLGQLLIDAEVADLGTQRALSALGELDVSAQQSFAALILQALFEGKLDADEAAAVWPVGLRGEALDHATDARQRAELELAAVAEQVARGEQAYVDELYRHLQPLIARAMTRAAGNSALEGAYARLTQELRAPTVEKEAEGRDEFDLPANLVDELSKVGAHIEDGNGTLVIFDDATADDGSRLRYLGVLDQRVQRSGTDPSLRDVVSRILPAYASGLAESGGAEHALRDLFEGGPLLPVAVQLSPPTRQLLLEAAMRRGFTPPMEWSAHSALGEWLRAVQLEGGEARSRGVERSDTATLATAFRLAQDAEDRLASTQSELRRQRHIVKEQFAQSAADVFNQVDALIDGYAQLWQGFSRIGIRQIAPPGLVIERAQLDPHRHELVGESSAERFIVRSPGLEIDGEVHTRAQLEGVDE